MAITLAQFMNALSGQESGGNYDITNQDSGAHGRFQIMPENWPSWAAEAGLGANAPKTPANQDRVAAFKLQQYYDRFGNWEDVAAAWYSGAPRNAYSPDQLNRKQGGGKYPSINEYVNSVISRAGGTPMSSSPTSGSTPSYDQAVAQLNGLLMNPPDPTLNDGEDYSIWLNSVTALTNVVRTLRPDATASGLDPAAEAANADFNRKIQQVNADISLGSLSLSQQVANIDRFLGGKEQADSRAKLIQGQKDAVTRYGAAPGKTAYSGRDMGGVGETYARILGKGLDDPLVNYSGTQYLDVEGDLAKYDQQMGVTGQIPGLTDVAGGITVPQASAVSFGGGSALPGQGVGQIDVSGGVNSVPLPAINQPSAAGTIEEPGIAKTPSPVIAGPAPLPEAAGQIDIAGQTGIAAPFPQQSGDSATKIGGVPILPFKVGKWW